MLLAATLAGCGGLRTPDRSIQLRSAVHTARLPNGVRILVVEDHGTNLIELGIRVDAGGTSDPPGKAGLAHLAEHLMFGIRGASGRPAAADLAAIALWFNAGTDLEGTTYVTTARADQLEPLLAIEAGRFSADCGAIDPGTFEREREVTRNELRVRGAILDEDGSRLLGHILPRGSRYARPVIGTDAELSRLTLTDTCAFLARHYRPERMVVVLSGDVSAARAIEAITRHLGPLAGWGGEEARAAPTAPPPAPPFLAGRRVVRGDAIFGGDPMLLVAWPLPRSYGPSDAATAVALSLLKGELSDAFGQDAQLVALGGRRAPIATALIRLGPDRRTEEDALAAVHRAVERAHVELDRHALEAVVVRHVRALLTQFDRMDTRVWRLAADYQLGGREHLFPAQVQAFDRLKATDVRAAVRLFARERAAVIRFEPGRQPIEPRHGQLTASYAGKGHDDTWSVPADPAEAEQPLRVPLPRSILERAERFRLSNGLRVVLLPTPGAPLLRAQLVFAGGRADDPVGQLGLGAIAANGLRFQTSRPIGARDARARQTIAWLLEDLEIEVGADRTSFSMTGLSSYLDVVLAGLVWLVQYGEYRGSVLAQIRRTRDHLREPGSDLFSPARQRWIDGSLRMRRAVLRAVFGDSHPYAKVELLGQSADGIERRDLEGVRKRRFGAQNGVLIVTGQFDRALVRRHVERWFSHLRDGEVQVIARTAPAPRSARAVIAVPSDPSDANASIEIAYATSAEPDRRAARMVLGRILRERMKRVREVLGAAYDVSAEYVDRTGPGMFFIKANVDAQRVDEALSTMVDELTRLRTGGTADLAESFVRARREVLYGLLAEESGAEEIGARIASLVQGNGALDSDVELARAIMNTTLDDLEPLLAADLAPEHEVIGLLGPAASIAAAKRTAGL